jgi:hypothetical protein
MSPAMRLAQLNGSNIEGTIQISEAALNDVLSRSRANRTRVEISMLPENVLLVTYGIFRERVALPRAVALADSPTVTVELASWTIATGLGVFVKQPYIRVRGRRITIDLAAIPALQRWSELWKHVRTMTFRTAPGALRVGFAMTVDESN